MESKKNSEAPQLRGSQSPIDLEARRRRFKEAHTPIIITDGSASIEFEDLYQMVSPGEFLATDLRIDRVELFDKNQTEDEEHISICRRIQPNKNHKITVQCGGKDFEVQVEGKNVRIKFDHTEYGPDTPTTPNRLKFKKDTRVIKGIEIQDDTPKVVHKCGLVPRNGSCTVTIFDEHLDTEKS